ncbi:glycine betaine ABC transporter substrate-binding protein [Chelativorans alearense]|uniref:ABC transporter substrate-binding protein n=1 Tax=Chelativorans alearense TaxID=2681495 RepID=UPI0013D7178C|nr:glycine betaine ABC transporter substrate-binding protein [Chelativorans alearense]
MQLCGIARTVLTAAAVITTLASARAADLVIAMPNWPSGQATANILKVSIAEKFGLDAEVRAMGTLSAFGGLDSGEVDIHPEVWRPNLDDLIRKYESDKGSVIVSLVGVPAWQGLCATPEAATELGIKDVADLSDPEKAAALDTDGDGRGEMWIGASTWSSTGIERVRANSYGYAETLTLVEAEEDVGMAAVDAAVATGQPMVFACYAPHHVFKLHDIVRLTEPAHDRSKWKIAPADDPLWISKSSASVAWGISHFHIAYSTKFGEEHPDVAAFLEKVNFRSAEVNAMTYALQVERQDPHDYAKKWVADNGARVEEWVKP